MVVIDEPMTISVSLSGLKQSRWYEYALRFLFGGLITAAAGVIAKEFGPAVGGLFLAFPAIFPASATLLEKHEREKKEKLGLNGSRRARLAVAADSVGAALGCFGLAAFALSTWWLLPRYSLLFVLPVSGFLWGSISVSAWIIWKRR